ncbi:CCA tRNA nucleotidyltransferase [Bombella sp. TMW 2.2559]|uniref:CCA tRNA nucleotidyltransferase n=1 Tax=Bombella dulcis TaxID=2967339 RepID=A0ABT3WCL0_9PROT|nr:CCA tRNA nucleotidyltransferase [Bombella dulcis]
MNPAPEILLEALSDVPGHAGLGRIWQALPQARLVGGCVRDLLCGREVHDLDLASPFPPEEAQQRLERIGARVIPTGLEHGTVTAVIDHHPYEITTLRRDVSTDGRHAVVAWTDDWQEDAQRRDFTINAMSLDQEGRLSDYFGGLDDLRAGRVRFVGHAVRRIEEDALRCLRFFRFFARYGRGEPDGEACQAITRLKDLMTRLSVERVAMELLKILSGPQLLRTLELMEETGSLAVLLPHHAPLSDLGRLLACDDPSEPLHRLAVLYPPGGVDGQGLAEVGVHLKLSNEGRAMLAALAKPEPELAATLDDDGLRRVLFQQDRSILLLRSWLVQAKELGRPDAGWDELRQRLEALEQPIFPLAGRDLIALGVKPGPDMGQWLKRAQHWWLEQGCRPDAGACRAWLAGQLSPR